MDWGLWRARLTTAAMIPSCWPIRRKFAIGVVLLTTSIMVLLASGMLGLYLYRGLVRGISQRASELPVATELFQQVSELRVVTQKLSECHRGNERLPTESSAMRIEWVQQRQRFQDVLGQIQATVERYREKLPTDTDMQKLFEPIGDYRHEHETVLEIEAVLSSIAQTQQRSAWVRSGTALADIEARLDELSELATTLPSFLQERMQTFSDEVRLTYRTLFTLTGGSSLFILGTMLVLGRSVYVWVLSPLLTLIQGSRIVAAGNFHHRIELKTQDEMAELAQALNDMTARFQEVRDDLDRQVQQRTREVVRSEQLASVGFLAAGVAHEINNPLASIALCAESLEERLADIIQTDDALPDDEHNAEIGTLREYLRMIQDEAFRCKSITERLLTFSRLGDSQRHAADLAELVEDVVDMLSHLGKYRDKHLIWKANGPVEASVNPQEFKQVVLNLITNAFDSCDPGGQVRVSLSTERGRARLTVHDNGCGMSDEVKQHLFEPFFTRRRDGQGTGLGLSITYRIVQDHGGSIIAESPGSGQGSTVVVTLPLLQAATKSKKEDEHRRYAA